MASDRRSFGETDGEAIEVENGIIVAQKWRPEHPLFSFIFADIRWKHVKIAVKSAFFDQF